MKKKILIITGSRAEYGLLKNLILKIKNDKRLESKLIVTGSHLSKEYGNTYKEILKDKINIFDKIRIDLNKNFEISISRCVGKAIIDFSTIFEKYKPNIIIVLGDRYEIFASVIAATFQKILVAHISGGDTTLGALDESMRHSISKMSYLHFVSSNQSKKRVIQLGEHPSRVFNVGHLGTERIFQTQFQSKEKIEKNFKFKFLKKNILITYHPVTLENNSSKKDFLEILKSIEDLKDTRFIFTYPNSDANGKIIIDMIENFIKNNQNNAIAFKSLGTEKYYQLLNHVDCVLGNSSSGILEVPSFKIPTINIGDRQKGRLLASSIINCPPDRKKIKKNIKKIYSSSFNKILKNLYNPYKFKQSSNKIYKIIKNYNLPINLKKKFYDIKSG